MTVIERCWITGGEFGGDKVLYTEADAAAWRARGHSVEGPFVRATTTQGAVGDAQQLAAAVRFLLLQPHKTVPHPDVVQEIVDRYPERAEPCAALPRQERTDA